MADATNYEFKMMQLVQTFVLKQDTGKDIAAYLDKLAHEWGTQGWEFYRVDSVGVLVQRAILLNWLLPKSSLVSDTL